MRRAMTAMIGVLIALLSWAPGAEAADIRVQRVTLGNGLQLQVVSRSAIPTLAVELALPVGARMDPPGQSGSANLVASLLTEGTPQRSGPEIADEIEFVGGSLGASAGRDFTTVSLAVLSRDAEMGLALLANVVRQPSFPQEEVTRVRQEILAGIQAQQDRPGQVAAKAFDQALYGSHAYGLPVEGLPETVAGINRTALVAFHKRHYRPGGAVLSFVGDITLEHARAMAQAAFGDWQGVSEAVTMAPMPPPPDGIKQVLIDRPVSQANAVMGHMGLTRSNPDFYPVVVMNYILGGGSFQSRLVDSVRDRQGLAYSIYSGFSAKLESGPFAVRFQTQNSNAKQAMDSVMVELRRMREEDVGAQELAEAKSYLAGSFPLRLDTNRKTSGLLTFIAMYGLGESYFSDYLQQVAAVTARDVRRVAQRYLHPDNMVWVVVADQEQAHVPQP